MNITNKTAVDGKIELIGRGEVKVEPDQVRIDYCVSVLKDTVQEAVKVAEHSVIKFFEKLKDLNLDQEAEAGDLSSQVEWKIKEDSTTDVAGAQSSQVEMKVKKEKTPEIAGYRVKRHVYVIVHDFSQISKVNSVALKCGLDRICGYRYSVSDTSKAEEEAAHKAANDVRHQASILAHEFGLDLGKPSSLTFDKDQRNIMPSTEFYRCSRELLEQGEEEKIMAAAVYKPSPISVKVTIRAEFLYQH